MLKPFALSGQPEVPTRPRASAIVIVRSRTLMSISLPCIFSSSGCHGTKRELLAAFDDAARRCIGRSIVPDMFAGHAQAFEWRVTRPAARTFSQRRW